MLSVPFLLGLIFFKENLETDRQINLFKKKIVKFDLLHSEVIQHLLLLFLTHYSNIRIYFFQHSILNSASYSNRGIGDEPYCDVHHAKLIFCLVIYFSTGKIIMSTCKAYFHLFLIIR